jgi:DDE family transposase
LLHNSIYLAELNQLSFLINWPSYNRSLIRRGEILFSYDFLDIWDSKLERMNKNKKGNPFEFPDSFILAIGYIRYSFRLPYRQTEGIINVTGKSLPSKPSYGHICKRINRLSVNIRNGRAKKDDDDYIIIAADSTYGIKVTNIESSGWIRNGMFLIGRLSQDPCSRKYKDKGNPCSRSNK